MGPVGPLSVPSEDPPTKRDPSQVSIPRRRLPWRLSVAGDPALTRVNLLGRPCVDRDMTSWLQIVNGVHSRPAWADLHRVGQSWTQSGSGAQTLAFDGVLSMRLDRGRGLTTGVDDTYPPPVVVPGGPQVQNEGCRLEVQRQLNGCKKQQLLGPRVSPPR